MSETYYLVGDVHAVKSELDDCRRLIDLIAETVQRTDTLVFLGDLYDNHGVIDLAVQTFWTESLRRLEGLCEHIVILAGNHDMHKNSKVKGSAVSLHVGDARTVVDGHFKKAWTDGPSLFLPFFHHQADFKKKVLDNSGHPLIFAHNTFQGAKYENGFYAPDGFPLDFPQKVISGHIHASQMLASQVWYPGAPRWFTKSDANEPKSVYRIEVAEDGVYKILEAIPTRTHCSPIYHFEDRESSPLNIEPIPNARYYIDLHGSEAWIKARRPLYAGWAKISSFPIRNKVVKVKESDGLGKAFQNWSDQFYTKAPKHIQSRLDKLKAQL